MPTSSSRAAPQPVRRTGLQNATMTRLGYVKFGVAPTSLGGAQWTFTGQRASDGTFSSSHGPILISAGPGAAASPYNGTWTATRR